MLRTLLITSAIALTAACTTEGAQQSAATEQNFAASQQNQAASMQQASATMAESADVDALQDLTRILIDASSLYEEAAKDAQNDAYAAELQTLSASREEMASMFQQRVIDLGGEAPEHGQALGTAHRVFMEARTLGDEDTRVAVEEVLRGEEYLADEMRETAENDDLSPGTRAFVSAQLPAVEQDRDRVEALKESLG